MIERKKILTQSAIILYFIVFLDILAKIFYWYYTIWWFDILMHFLGGVFIFFLLSYLFYNKRKILFLLVGVLVIGLFWEVFEFIFNNRIGGMVFEWGDTLFDLVFDALGGITGFFLVKK